MNIAVAVVHGIGRQKKTYADEFIKSIEKTYSSKTGEDNLVFESICWQDAIEPLEIDLYEKVKTLGYSNIRDLLIGYAGDAICYQPSKPKGIFYDLVHRSIDFGLSSLALRAGPNAPLFIISHSLGTVVMSNFLWDVKHNQNSALSKETEEIIDRLEVFYTMGSPLSIWSLRFPSGGEPISIKRTSYWYNLYSRNDVISSPLKIINQHYSIMPNLFDVEMRVGGILTSWNPLSHNDYWTSKPVINHICTNLKRVNSFYKMMEVKKCTL